MAGEVRHADISIHDLRKESDTGERRQMAKLLLFQSTLSVRRATILYGDTHDSSLISIHALRKESDFGFRGSVAGKHISIHALRKESDRVQLRLGQVGAISIHALRKESDVSGNAAAHDAISNFNPRSP